MKIEVTVGDIFEQKVDAIVNPAHPSLLAGSGLCGKIFKQAGKSELENFCRSKLQRMKLNALAVGQTIITPAFNLPFQSIIHTAVPKFYQHGVEALTDCYLNSIKLAIDNKLMSLAFPALGIGINQIPIEASAQKMREAIDKINTDLGMEIIVVTRDEFTQQIFSEALA